MTRMTTDQFWTVSSETGRFVGPFDQMDLNRLVAEGRLTTKSPVFKSATRKWTEIGCVLAPPDLPSHTASSPFVGPPQAWGAVETAPRSMPLGFVAAFTSGAVLAGLLTAWIALRYERSEELVQKRNTDVQASAAGHIASVRENWGGDAYGPSPIESRFQGPLDARPSSHADPSGIDRTMAGEQPRIRKRSSDTPDQDTTENGESVSVANVTESTKGRDREVAGVEDPSVSLLLYRKWHDDTGRYSTTARLVGVDGSIVTLLRPDGAMIGVDRARLSEADWLFTEAVAGRRQDRNGPEGLIEEADPVDEDPATQLTAIATSRQRSASPLQVGRTRSMDEVDRDRFAAYLDRRDERRVYATERLRQIHSMRGPHVYRTAVYAPVNAIGGSAIQAGWVYQPPIYRSSYRPYRSAPSCSPRRLDSRYNYGYGYGWD